MAPISLKDNNIAALTEQLVSQLTKFKKSSRNFTLSSQFALSNFRYHKFLDVNSLAVTRLIEGVIQKFKVHSQHEKAEAFESLCEEFEHFPISHEVKTDTHYSLISLLLLLSNSPTHNDYEPSTKPSELSEDTFDWKAYLLDDAEEEILGIPHYGPSLAWSDEDDLDSDISETSAKDSAFGRSVSSDDQKLSLYSVTNQSTQTEKGRLWLAEHVVSQYWEDYPVSSPNQHNPSKYGQCTVANTWETFQRSQNLFHQYNTKKILTETQIVKETLWMLSGSSSSFIYQYHKNKIQVRENIQVSHLTPNSLQSMLKSFAAVGEQSYELQQFKASVLESQRTVGTTQPSMTMQAFATSLSMYFKECKASISEIEKVIIKKESSVTLLGLQEKLSPKLKEISALYVVYKEGVLQHMDKSLPQRVTHLLDAFYHSMHTSDTLGLSLRWKVAILLRVFLDTVRPCFEFIDSWVTSGTLNDPANEFFIQRNDAIPFQSTSYWEKGLTLRENTTGTQQTTYTVPVFLSELLQQILVAGKSVNLIQALGKMASTSDTKGASLYQDFLESFLSVLSTKSTSNIDEHGTDDDDDDDDDDDALDRTNNNRISLANRADIIAVTNDIGDPMLRASLLSSAAVNSPRRQADRAKKDRYKNLRSGLQRCLVPVEVLFNQVLSPLLQDKYTQACGALLSILKSEYNLMDHLDAMKNFYLLEAGQTMHDFYVDIFKKVRRRQSWQDISYLNSLLQEALYPRFPTYIDRLAVSLSPNTTGFKSGTVQTLQNMTLNYKVPWPVSVVIDEFCLNKYNQVLLFLLTVKQAKWSLDELRFTDLSGQTNIQTQSSDEEDDEDEIGDTKDTPAKPPVNEQLMHKMYLLRFKLLHFVNGLHNYIMTRILHTTGLEFQAEISKVVDLNDVIAVHRAYVEKVFDRCLLSQKVGFVKDAITKVLNLALLFQTRWDASVQQISEAAFNKIDTEFSKCNHYVNTFLDSIVKRGAFPHLEALAYSLSASPDSIRITRGANVKSS